MRYPIYIFLIICICLSGCSSWTEVTRNEQGQITKIESKGNVDTTFKGKDEEWSQSTKSEPFIKLPDLNMMKADN